MNTTIEILVDMTPSPGTIRFTEEDLALFSRASGDCNPLHLSTDYARRTPYGERVVFGALGAVACLGHAPLGSGDGIASLTAGFLRPILLGIDYRVESGNAGDGWNVRLLDGSVPVVVVKVRLRTEERAMPEGEFVAWHFECTEARVLSGPETAPGFELSGNYACDPVSLDALQQRWNVRMSAFPIETLLWASYFVGMELPGRSALFSRFTITFGQTPRHTLRLEYTVTVRSFDASSGQLRAAFTLRAGECVLGSGEYRSFVRPTLELETADLPTGERLSGRVAVITGTSRGLGAAFHRALKSQGAAVVGIARGADTFSNDVVVGDACSAEVLAGVRERVVREYGRLDFLVCNACPPVLPLRLELAALSRIDEYVSRAVSLVAHPLAAFLDLLGKCNGCCVVVSSIAVENPVREWPHYVAAKRAVEGLAQVGTMQFPKVSSLIVRPEKLLTDMTNTPMGRRGAASPIQFAMRVVERLQKPLQPGTSEVFR